MKTSPNHSTILTDITTNPELVENFMDYMKLITKQTGVDLVIDTQREGIARMQPGKTKVFFNPVFTLQQLQAIADKRAKELSVENTFQFTINHLSEIVLHEINHMINHTQLKMSKKTEKLDDKTLNMLDYQGQLYKKYGKDFKKFENMFEDIDVNNQATKLQAPVFETSKQEIYQHLCAPDTDFSEQPLPEQFAWASLRESMVTKEPCTIDPLVRMYITYASQPG
ncbi:hypothetical protein FACS189428_3710 [Clostridia bacterium]|nr:hypothetical protein FACS189428_3710 [Clostridia bacterium]